VYEVATTEVAGDAALRAVAIALVTLPVAVRRRYPLAGAVVSMSGLVLEALTMDAMNSLAELLAGLMLAYAIPRYLPLERALLGIPLLMIGIAAHRVASPGSEIVDLLFDVAVVSAAWALGYAARRREDRNADLERRAALFEAERARAAREAAVEERLRIARELHDIVAHGLGVIAVKAGATEQLLSRDPDGARESLAEIRATVREAVVEMRRMLGLLRAGEASALAPQPSLAEVGDLVDRFRETGLDVGVLVEGRSRPLSASVELSAFRIIQEALTNVVKHAKASRAQVVITYGPGSLDVDVADNGTGQAGDPGGHGLVGVGERVALHGGRFEAGPRAGGGFGLHAVLPVDAGAVTE
jgi:signal transduction histidine kinase